MYEPPADLTLDAIRGYLRDHYALTLAELSYLALGLDSAAWVYRARTVDGRAYFVKVRTGLVNVSTLHVPRFLRDHGVEQVVAPLPTNEGVLWASVAGYVLILYPFIDGAAGMAQGLSTRQWVDFGTILRQVHATTPDAALTRMMRRETFEPVGVSVIDDVHQRLDTLFDKHPAARDLAVFWRSRQEDIRTLRRCATALGRRLARAEPPFILCHADIHTNNVMLGADGRVWIVDWDETVLAPRERDLIFVIGGLSSGLVGPEQEESFFQGYGATSVAPLALAYYRYARAVEDIGAFAEEIFFRPDIDPDSKHKAVEYFKLLFLPGSIVDLAFRSDAQAAPFTRGGGGATIRDPW